jgi:hypothetical protein
MAARLSLKQKTQRSERCVELREQGVTKAIARLKDAVLDIRTARKVLQVERADLSALLRGVKRRHIATGPIAV